MANPPKQMKMIKAKTLHPVRLMRDGSETIVKEGTPVELTEEEAKEFCDKDFEIGHRDVFGYQDVLASRPAKIRRAERL